MFSPVEAYVAELAKKYATGQAREHTYRSAVETLIANLGIKVHPLNEPKHSESGAPDFAFTRGDLILGYAEAKDVTVNLEKIEKTEQMQRYLAGYANLILTNYLEFRFFQNGQPYEVPIVVARIENDHIAGQTENYAALTDLLRDFLSGKPEQIKSGARLAKIMGGKARRIRDNVRHFLADKAEADTDLHRIYESVKKMLVHDLTPEAFADMYAQTLVYGLFVARYYDESATDEEFSRAKARDLVPESNPFLRQFFNHIAGADFNKRLSYIVDELCLVFAHADVRELMDEYFKKNGATQGQDPVIHFYEDFLKEYDAELRKKMGAYYTPLPVVRFIVRAVDHVLKTDFGLADGLADTAKLPDGRHKVQVLDPAVGTGTFISAVIRLIYERLLEQGQKGRWPAYVHHDLLPRIHGFELMMAAYTIAHLKLSIAFKQTGFTIFNKRLGIYLTNSLEQASPQADLLSIGFAQSIAEEAKEAAVIKNETPIMVVMGNPPYSVSSSNKGERIQNLIKDYKKGLDEKKINLDDDYIKFLRFAEHFIEKNKSGVVAMITNNSFIDGITHRQMRKHMLETFDDIHVLDLHGNAKKKEKTPQGGKDENVFDIQQGVAISIFVRKEGTKQGLGSVHHAELYGVRESKFAALDTGDMKSIKWETLKYAEPSYFFVPKDFAQDEEYNKGIKLDELFEKNVTNIVTSRDSIAIDFDKKSLLNRFQSLIEEGRSFIPELKNTRDWDVDTAIQTLKMDRNISEKIKTILYRPFDTRYIFYTDYFLDWPRMELMPQLLKPNLGLVSTRQVTGKSFNHILVTKWITEYKLGSHDRNSYTFPLFLYTEDGTKVPNLKKEIVRDVENIVGKTAPEDIFDYIYAILHSPSYREKYKEFLKIDFPRVPYPKDKKQFIALTALGKELREIHLLESKKIRPNQIPYPESGSDTVEKPTYKDGRVYINKTQYFDDVPESAWNFYIGGYQPAQKWLKDRKGRTLTNEDIEHYQKIIVVLVETDRIMEEIDNIN